MFLPTTDCHAVALEASVYLLNPSWSTAQFPPVMWEISVYLAPPISPWGTHRSCHWPKTPHPLSSQHALSWQTVFLLVFAVRQLTALLSHGNILHSSYPKEWASRPSPTTPRIHTVATKYLPSPVPKAVPHIDCLVEAYLEDVKLVSAACRHLQPWQVISLKSLFLGFDKGTTAHAPFPIGKAENCVFPQALHLEGPWTHGYLLCFSPGLYTYKERNRSEWWRLYELCHHKPSVFRISCFLVDAGRLESLPSPLLYPGNQPGLLF